EDRHEQERHDAFLKPEEIDEPLSPGHWSHLPIVNLHADSIAGDTLSDCRAPVKQWTMGGIASNKTLPKA
ncbi:MAG: hypothetical protein ABIA59_02320, partial [Candidatus Latescibacterota bacterium]